MSRLSLTLACWDYDRTRALETGRVKPEGIDLTYLPLPVEETFFRMLRHREFDAAEMSLSSYVMTLARDDRPFVAIPAFPSRAFRHSCIFVHSGSAIGDPADLAGRTVGIPEYQMSAAVWIRGILAEHHGLPVEAVTYRTGGLEQPGRPEKLQLSLPDGVIVEPIGSDQVLSEMLATGEIDALYTARTPSSYGRQGSAVTRLFPDPRAVEREYFARTGIFPIMHVIALRRELYEANPWVAQELTKAFTISLEETKRELDQTAALKYTLPWIVEHVSETREAMGDDFWTYGFHENRDVIDTFLRYSYEQGLSPRRMMPEEIFAPESLESFVI